MLACYELVIIRIIERPREAAKRTGGGESTRGEGGGKGGGAFGTFS